MRTFLSPGENKDRKCRGPSAFAPSSPVGPNPVPKRLVLALVLISVALLSHLAILSQRSPPFTVYGPAVPSEGRLGTSSPLSQSDESGFGDFNLEKKSVGRLSKRTYGLQSVQEYVQEEFLMQQEKQRLAAPEVSSPEVEEKQPESCSGSEMPFGEDLDGGSDSSSPVQSSRVPRAATRLPKRMRGERKRPQPAVSRRYPYLTDVERTAVELDMIEREGRVVDDAARRAYLYKNSRNRTWLPNRFNESLGSEEDIEVSFSSIILRDERMDAFITKLRKHMFRMKLETLRSAARQKIILHYAYYDGVNHHPSTIEVRLHYSIRQVLQRIHERLVTSFTNLKHRRWENFMIVKKNNILRHEHTFYDLLLHKKNFSSKFQDDEPNTPLFDVDIENDVQTGVQVSIENDTALIIDKRVFEEKKKGYHYPMREWDFTDKFEAESQVSDSAGSSDQPDFGYDEETKKKYVQAEHKLMEEIVNRHRRHRLVGT
mmetsp:Transcript_11409/g.28088  ORF Transcript_11409/g.28088 Transcript_11409/m.28088 type:complete len:486 (-) Transcript_11409:238-1695(-)|eukprot:CAMPEP_0114513506 /NCGR_PEP_ID=MMETSP0109-20121206/15615_1 /TAXON_ID=29199 /ORGANISM="Chlorarachnion reptans, Strain CCCM449" /LENGTH=485 /DNA_ID=CAMNT_0001693401 /DNA_START=139 /DNA_END=1596 /DNA_ORIENTATION=-